MKSGYKTILILLMMAVAGLLIYFGWQKLTSEPASNSNEPTVIATSTDASASTDSTGAEEASSTGFDKLTTGEVASSTLENGEASTPSTSSTSNLVSQLETPSKTIPSQLKLEKISKTSILNFWTSQNNGEVYYITENGKVFSYGVTTGGSTSLTTGGSTSLTTGKSSIREISQQEIKNILFTLASPNKERLLALFEDWNNPWAGIFDVIDGVWRPLPQGIMSATWTSSPEKLIAIMKSGKENNLVEFNVSKNPPEYRVLIKDFPFKDVSLDFKEPNSIIISEKTSALYNTRVWKLDLEKLSFNTLLSENGLLLNWLNQEDVVFKFSSPQSFFILDGNLEPSLPVPFTTLPQKCTTIKNMIYCFVPDSIPDAIVLPDDYMTRAFYSTDVFFVTDKEDPFLQRFGEKNIINYEAFDATNPQYYSGSIYFINRYNGFLYKLGENL